MNYFQEESKRKPFTGNIASSTLNTEFTMRFGKLVRLCCMSLAIFILFSGCNRKLDEDGGYYDEKTRSYKYVKPKRRNINDASPQIYAPRAGEAQTIGGTVARIDEDAKSVWIKIEDRKIYMILASSLSGSNRDDKTKTLRLNLSYVSPAGSINGSKRFRAQWKKYVIQTLGSELLNREILAELNYEERSRRFTGSLFRSVKTTKGERTQDVNLWMIQQGLSFYFLDQGKSPKEKDYLQAQKNARKGKKGVWRY